MDSKRKILSHTQASFIEILLISVLMTAVMSIGMILVQSSDYKGIWDIWVKQFLTGCMIAVPAGFILVPLIQWAVDRYTIISK
jgi:hypothetical protein